MSTNCPGTVAARAEPAPWYLSARLCGTVKTFMVLCAPRDRRSSRPALRLGCGNCAPTCLERGRNAPKDKGGGRCLFRGGGGRFRCCSWVIIAVPLRHF